MALDMQHLSRIGICSFFQASKQTPATKVVVLRHGESVAQTYTQEERWHPASDKLCDPPLTGNGVKQALMAGAQLRELGFSVDVVLCSPLTRAAMTAVLAFGATGIPIIALPCLREFAQLSRRRWLLEQGLASERDTTFSQQWECVGRSIDQITSDFSCSGDLADAVDGEHWACRVDWSGCCDPWWSMRTERPDEISSRLALAHEQILSFNADRVALVAHFNILRGLTGTKRKLENCCPIFFRVDGAGKWCQISQDEW